MCVPSPPSSLSWSSSRTLADVKSLPQYTPQPPEPVLGIIIARHAEGYRVDIGGAQAASLDALAFEGATKRNKPNLKVRPAPALRRPVSMLSRLIRESAP